MIDMNISGIRPYGGAYDYNSIQGTGAQQPENIRNVPAAESAAPEPERDYGRQTFGAGDYAGQYQPEASYELKGADSDIHSLDVERALSDLRKDQVLQQYQFFVGESQGQRSLDNMAAAETRSVRAMENFDL